MIEGAGFTYNPPDIIPNTLPTLLLAELARDHGSFEEVHGALFKAYWSEARNIGDANVLAEIAVAGGLEVPEYARALEDRRYTSRVIESTNYAHSIGVTGVPAWLIDDRLLIVGAQPHAALERILKEQGYSTRAA